jgi:hypothetical protein
VYNRVTADQGFQYFIHDNEHSMGTGGTGSIDRTGPFNNGNQNSYNHSNPQYLHQDLMFHPEYKQRFIDKVQEHMFNGGVMTPAASIARLQERVSESDPAIIAEAARWGDSKVHPPRNKSTWQTEINWLKNTYLPSRGNIVLNQLRTDGLYTTFAAPVFSQHGGMVSHGYPLAISWSAEGTVYYTTDGATDPRMIGGGVNPAAAVQVYGGPISITDPTTVKARLLTSTGQWSGIVEASFVTPSMPGDYNDDTLVDDTDYLVWRANFGNSIQPGTSADGTGDGIVDAADYVVWRKARGAAIDDGNNGFGSSVGVAALELLSADSLAEYEIEDSERPSLAFLSGTNADEGVRPSGRDSQIRASVREPNPRSTRDLLLTMDLWSGSRLVGKAPNSNREAAPDELGTANEVDIAQSAWDEVFNTLGDISNNELSALSRKLSSLGVA